MLPLLSRLTCAHAVYGRNWKLEIWSMPGSEGGLELSSWMYGASGPAVSMLSKGRLNCPTTGMRPRPVSSQDNEILELIRSRHEGLTDVEQVSSTAFQRIKRFTPPLPSLNLIARIVRLQLVPCSCPSIHSSRCPSVPAGAAPTYGAPQSQS